MKDIGMKRIGVFLLFTFLVSWSLELLLGLKGGLNHPNATMAMTGIFLIPALGNLFTRKVTYEGFKKMYLFPNWKGNARWYAFALFGTIAAVAVGCTVYFVVNAPVFDGKIAYYTTFLQEEYAAHGMDYTYEEMYHAILVQIAGGMFLGTFLSLPRGLGIELGFRGYLMPKLMERYSMRTALILGGVIWGIWYAPLTYMGLYYGTDYRMFPLFGFLAVILFCIVVGIISSFLTWKTGSCLPAALVFAVIDGYGSIGMYFCNCDVNTLNPFIGPSVYGILGGSGLLLMAVLCLVLFDKGKSYEEKD